MTIMLLTTILTTSFGNVALAKGNDKKEEKREQKELKMQLKAEVKAQKHEDKKDKDDDKKAHVDKFCRGNWWNFNNWLWQKGAIGFNPCGPRNTPATSTPDTIAPVISGLNVLRTTARSATIEWKTNENSTSVIHYGTTTAYGMKKKDDDRDRNHRIKIKKLVPNTIYNFVIVAKDRAGNTSTSTNMTFTTKPKNVADTTAPLISNVTVSVGTSTARIQWTTNETATGDIDFGTTTAYGSNKAGSTSGTAQDIILSDLLPSTTYHFKVSAEDTSGNNASTTDATFTTGSLPVVDTTAPVISSIAVSGLASTTATVSWNTNELATGKVYYGTTSPIGLGAILNIGTTTLSTGHSFNLLGLTASTTYYFLLESKDGNNNATTSAEQSFTSTQ